MGVATADDTPPPSPVPDLRSPFLLSKLQDHGYTLDPEIPSLVSLLFENMDSKALILLDRILTDLANIAQDSQRLQSVASDLRLALDQEKHETCRLSAENDELRARIRELELEPRTKKDGEGGESEDHIRQWRAQSLHQLQELEHMNQALRNALSRYTAHPSAATLETPCGGHISVSKLLSPSAKEMEQVQQRHDVQRICEKKEVDVSEEKNDHLQKKLKAVQEELSSRNKEIERLSLLIDASKNDGRDSTQSTEYNPVDEQNPGRSKNTRADDDQFKKEIQKLQVTVQEQESLIVELHSQLQQNKEQLSFIMDEKVVVEEALSSNQSECKQLSLLIKELDERLVQLQTALATRTSERDSAIATVKKETDTWKLAEEELKKKCNDLVSDLKALREQHLVLQNERDELKKQGQRDRSKHELVLGDLRKCQTQLEATQKDTEQLKSLVTQLDLTREELVEKLKMSISDRLLSENQAKSLEIEAYRLSKEVDMSNAELGKLHKLLETLGEENDHLHAEVEARDAKLAALSEENKRLIVEIRQLNKDLENAEQKLHAEMLTYQNAESEVLSLRDRLCMEEESRKAAEERCVMKAAELETLAEHLTTTTCEFQLVKAELLQVASDRENLAADLKDLTSRFNYCQQLMSNKEEEAKALSNSYNQLVEEHQQLKLAAIELDAQVQQQVYQLQNADDLLRSSQEHSNMLEQECRKLKNHIKEMEKQVENLSCSLAQRSSLFDNMQKEKAGLISQVSSMKKVTLEIEEKNNNLIREVKAAESNNQLLMGVIHGKMQEAESYATKYRLEHERVRELDQLVTYFRAQEHQLQIESKDASGKIALMNERIAAFEEQIRLLQKSKDGQREEIFRLTGLLKEKNDGGNGRINGMHVHDGFLNRYTQSADSESKLQELELKTTSLAADLSKTEALYKDCLSRLQKAEAQCAEQRSEYDHLLSILSKVDDDRLQLQQRCRQLVNVGGLGNGKKANDTKAKLERIPEVSEVEEEEKSE